MRVIDGGTDRETGRGALEQAALRHRREDNQRRSADAEGLAIIARMKPGVTALAREQFKSLVRFVFFERDTDARRALRRGICEFGEFVIKREAA